MSITTIKVTKETRDRLKAQAATRRQTLDEYLRGVAEREARREDMRLWAESVRGTQPELMESWRQETAGWDTFAGDGLEKINDEWS